MSKRASLLMQIAGVIAVVGGVYVAYSSWIMTAATKPHAPGLLSFMEPGSGFAFADSLTGTLGHDLALPRLLITEPLIWLGLALILTTRLYHRIVQQGTKRDPAYASYAYVECPECRGLVAINRNSCPLCGAQLFSPWPTVSSRKLGASGQRG